MSKSFTCELLGCDWPGVSRWESVFADMGVTIREMGSRVLAETVVEESDEKAGPTKWPEELASERVGEAAECVNGLLALAGQDQRIVRGPRLLIGSDGISVVAAVAIASLSVFGLPVVVQGTCPTRFEELLASRRVGKDELATDVLKYLGRSLESTEAIWHLIEAIERLLCKLHVPATKCTAKFRERAAKELLSEQTAHRFLSLCQSINRDWDARSRHNDEYPGDRNACLDVITIEQAPSIVCATAAEALAKWLERQTPAS